MARVDSSKSSVSAYTYKISFYEKPFYHYLLLALVALSLVVSLISLFYVSQLKEALVPKVVGTQDFLKRLTAHNEMKAYSTVSPLNIVQINSNNLANLQSQIDGLDASYIGNFIVQYTDRIVVYDFEKDQIRGSVAAQQGQLPSDFFAKLNRHPELKGLENEQPVGGQLDAASLSTLKQQFPDFYANAKVGDFLLRYQSKLMIYDYKADRIVNSIKLQ